MPADLQTRLLRVLADGEFYRVGGHTPIKVDVRIIAATHQDIEERVKEGSFREDLLHRLNVIRVHVPPLRERPEDIVELLNHFLKLAAAELKIETKKLVSETEKFLLNAEWSGNVRQLENFCRWVTVMAPGRDIHVDDLPPELRGSTGSGNSATDWEAGLFSWINSNLENGETNILGEALPKFERIMIEAALQIIGLGKKHIDAEDKRTQSVDISNFIVEVSSIGKQVIYLVLSRQRFLSIQYYRQ
jgi:two-component system, NtrC family, nitrogen regulation response regulator GlnG